MMTGDEVSGPGGDNRPLTTETQLDPPPSEPRGGPNVRTLRPPKWLPNQQPGIGDLASTPQYDHLKLINVDGGRGNLPKKRLWTGFRPAAGRSPTHAHQEGACPQLQERPRPLNVLREAGRERLAAAAATADKDTADDGSSRMLPGWRGWRSATVKHNRVDV